MTKFRIGLVATCALAMTVGAVGMAGAIEKVRIPSTIKITKTSPKFKGKVSSPNGACKVDRKVKLRALEPRQFVGKATTNSRGRWKIAFQGEGVVHYRAIVKRRAENSAGKRYICRKARSQVVIAG